MGRGVSGYFTLVRSSGVAPPADVLGKGHGFAASSAGPPSYFYRPQPLRILNSPNQLTFASPEGLSERSIYPISRIGSSGALWSTSNGLFRSEGPIRRGGRFNIPKRTHPTFPRSGSPIPVISTACGCHALGHLRRAYPNVRPTSPKTLTVPRGQPHAPHDMSAWPPVIGEGSSCNSSPEGSCFR